MKHLFATNVNGGVRGAHLFQIEIKKQQDEKEEESISQNITTDSDIENHRLSGWRMGRTDRRTDEEQSQMVMMMMTVMIMTFIPPTNRHRHRHQNSMAATSTSFAMLFLLVAECCR